MRSAMFLSEPPVAFNRLVSSAVRFGAVCFCLLSVTESAHSQPESGATRPAVSAGAADVPARYPLDPICPWGRISDGQGLLVRCLRQREASSLMAGFHDTPDASPAGRAASNPPKLAVQPPPAPVDSSPRAVRPRRAPQRVVFRRVGPAKPDSGSLPEAQPQLSRPKQRYVKCVEKNGGVEGQTAQVVVKFLVRERGRAEGVAVESRRGMSLAAARCIADVVDRRYVGFPEAPIVGATLEIELAAEPVVAQ